MIFRPQVWERHYIAPRDPGTAALVSIGSSIIGTGLGVVGQINQANAAAGQANYMAAVARNNQQIMEQNAKLAEQRGAIAAQQNQQKTAQVIGAQRAALGAQGADVNSGSPLDIQTDTARAGAYDTAAIKSNAAWEAYGYRLQGAGQGQQSGLYQTVGANAMSSLPFGIGSSLLSGASSVAGKWKDAFGSSPVKQSYGPEFDL
jgi:hypothetical protein